MQIFTPEQYLQIAIATTFGLDRENWEDRLSWFEENEYRLTNLIHLAEEPAKYFSAVNAYYEAIQGNPIGFLVPLDATASGKL